MIFPNRYSDVILNVNVTERSGVVNVIGAITARAPLVKVYVTGEERSVSFKGTHVPVWVPPVHPVLYCPPGQGSHGLHTPFAEFEHLLFTGINGTYEYPSEQEHVSDA